MLKRNYTKSQQSATQPWNISHLKEKSNQFGKVCHICYFQLSLLLGIADNEPEHFTATLKQLLDVFFLVSRVIKVKAGADNSYRDLDYSGYHKIRI